VETLSTSAAKTFSVRQQGLLSAAVRVVARSGLRGLTHRAVDREAGLPEGSCSAYMRTRLALLTRLTEYVISQFARDVEQLTQRVAEQPGAHRYAVEQTAAMLRSWLLRPELLITRMELSLEGSRQPEIARFCRAQSRQLVDVVEHAMVSTAGEHGRERAGTLIAALDGVLLHALQEAPADRASYLSESVELLMGALGGGPTEPTV
jgi:DNA-binding transcriptional regulator YbjK